MNTLYTSVDFILYVILHNVEEKGLTQKLLLSPAETCEMLGLGRATLFKLLASGAITSIKVGRLRRIPAAGLMEWVQRQVVEQVSKEGEPFAMVSEREIVGAGASHV
jgi:excisionase family DNA binding protein